MTRARRRENGRPTRFNRLRSPWLLAVLGALLLAGCEATLPSSGATSVPTTAPTAPTASEAPATPGASTPVPTPTARPGSSPSSSVPAPTGTTAPAAACSGTDAHRDFYVAVAEAVAWDVYCAVLPTGWFLEKGSYRLSGGGRMEVSYKGPAGGRLELRAGAFCTQEDGCIPAGSDVGPAAFGGLTGTLIAGSDGSWIVVVAPGETISWLAVGTGVDEGTLRGLAEAFALVDR